MAFFAMLPREHKGPRASAAGAPKRVFRRFMRVLEKLNPDERTNERDLAAMERKSKVSNTRKETKN